MFVVISRKLTKRTTQQKIEIPQRSCEQEILPRWRRI